MRKTKISVNKLAEYLIANPARRRKILQDQKEPNAFKVTRYSKARKAIINYFLNGKGDKNVIKEYLNELIRYEFESSFLEQDRKLTIEALEVFYGSNLELDLRKYSIVPVSFKSSRINISGIDISVMPDVIIHGTEKGKEFIGAIKLNLVKSHPLDYETGSYVSTILHNYLQQEYPNKKVNLKFCVCYDVFTNTIYYAPRSYKQRRKHIKAACEEIKLIWPHI